jgi:glucose-6-phosphate dehydrogenase assembly protein OpcA
MTAAEDREPDLPRLVELELPALTAYNAVGRLVVGGVASRLDFEIADIEDLQLAVEAVLCREPARSTVTVLLRPSRTGLSARLGPFAANGDRERMVRTLRRLVKEAVVQDSHEGEWVLIRAGRERATARGSS